MKTLKWNNNISVNNRKIDKQHQSLFDLTNNLIKNYNADVNSEIISESLSKLLEYTRTHFVDEEKMLKEIQYPKLEEHQNEHRKFKYKMAMFSKDVIDGKEEITKEMTMYLADWLLKHTSVDDQDYKKYF